MKRKASRRLLFPEGGYISDLNRMPKPRFCSSKVETRAYAATYFRVAIFSRVRDLTDGLSGMFSRFFGGMIPIVARVCTIVTSERRTPISRSHHRSRRFGPHVCAIVRERGKRVLR